jgi:hypothetical protein
VYTIYLRRTPDDKVYIGCTTVSLEILTRLGYGSTDFQRAIDKFGWDNIQSEVLDIAETMQEAHELEQKYIEQYDAMNPDRGYNRKGSGYSMSRVRRIQMSKNTKEFWKDESHLDKMKEAIAESRKSPEYRQKVSEAIKEKWQDERYRKKVSNSMRVRMQNPEVKKQMSDATRQRFDSEESRKQHSNLMKEVMHRPEVRAKFLESREKIDWHSEAMIAGRKACAEANRGTICISKMISGRCKRLRVRREVLENYLEDGWVVGWTTKGPGIAISRIENGIIVKKRAKADELDNYLRNGWKKGWKAE